MADQFLAEIRLMSFGFAPSGWAQCNGQLLPINQNQALFSLLGTTYGGNGTTVFALPNFQGRAPIHFGNGFVQGQLGGSQSHGLTIQELPAHTHALNASANRDTVSTPTGNLPGANTLMRFSSTPPDVSMDGRSVSSAGGSQPHENMQPYLTLNFCIALQGVFPSQT